MPRLNDSPPPAKQYPTIACCGIDCGLCPRFYTAGDSRCPGCYGNGFALKHPSCGFITCCVKKKGFEVCGGCGEFPCRRFDRWDVADSFVTHSRSIENLRTIKRDGMTSFLSQQRKRIRLLETMLREFDDGRSRSFFCQATALLPLCDLDSAIRQARTALAPQTKKLRTQGLKARLQDLASRRGLSLRLRKPEGDR